MIPQTIITPFMTDKINEKKKYSDEINNKFLVLIACHTVNEEKLNILRRNYLYFKNTNCHIVVINSSLLPLSKVAKKEFESKVFKYIEIPNDKWMDFGKWNYALSNIDYKVFDFVVFTNDSFSIHHTISHFFNLTAHNNVELYGYNSSSEIKYHYQSYLFSIAITAIPKFIDYFASKKKENKGAVQMEIHLLEPFSTKKCYLDIGKLIGNVKKNIFFNKYLYYPFFYHKLLPFIKLKTCKSVYPRTMYRFIR